MRKLILDHFKDSVFQLRKTFEKTRGQVMLGDGEWTGERLRYLCVSFKNGSNFLEIGYSGGGLSNNINSKDVEITKELIETLPTTVEDFDILMKKLNIERLIKEGDDTVVLDNLDAKIIQLN